MPLITFMSPARIFFILLTFISVLYLPWWLSALLILIGTVVFRSYYAGVMTGLVYDSLYSVPVAFLGNFNFLLTAWALLVIVLVVIGQNVTRRV
jgi:hypothetical protein